MNRRGFIGGLIGLAGVVVGSKIAPPQLAAATTKPAMRLRQVLVDARDIDWSSPESEKVIMDMLYKHHPVVRQLQKNL